MPFFTLKKAWNGHSPETTPHIEIKDDDSAAPLLSAGILEKMSGDASTDMIAHRATAAMVPSIVEQVTKQLDGMLQGLTEVDRRRLNIAAGALAADKTKSFGNFLSCVLNGEHDRIQKVYMSTKAPLAEYTGTGGGYLVPPEYMNTLLRLAAEKSVVRPRARIIPMGSRTVQIPALSQGGAAVAGAFQSLAGMVATWTEEGKQKQETEPNFRQIELVAHELAGYSVASRTLMADSAQALDALLTGLF